MMFKEGGPRLLVTRRWPAEAQSAMAGRYDVTFNDEDRKLTPAELADAMRRFDILCPTVSDPIDAAVLSVSGRKVRLIANYGAGTDHIDLAAARAAGIAVSNTPDVLTEATADLALMLMLMASRRAGEGERELRGQRWSGWRPTHLLGQSLSGKLLALVGFGRIGQATAKRGRALGLRIAYHARHRADRSVEQEHEAIYYPSLPAMAAAADILSLHCQGGEATRGMVDAALLSGMKPTTILINTARGSVVVEEDLARALAGGVIAAAGLDVYQREPAVQEGLLALENVVLLPHLGSATREARVAMGMRALANIDRYIASGALLDPV